MGCSINSLREILGTYLRFDLTGHCGRGVETAGSRSRTLGASRGCECLGHGCFFAEGSGGGACGGRGWGWALRSSRSTGHGAWPRFGHARFGCRGSRLHGWTANPKNGKQRSNKSIKGQITAAGHKQLEEC